MTQLEIILCALVGALFTGKGSHISGDCTQLVPFTFSWLIGAILGDWKTGLIIGATIQTLNMAPVQIGGVTSMDMWFAAVVCVPLVIRNGMSADMALAIAAPLAVVYNIIKTTIQAVYNDGICDNIVVKHCKNGDYKRLMLDEMLLFWIPRFLVYFVVCYIFIASGSAIASSIATEFPAWVAKGMTAAAGLLPGVGFALFLYVVGNKRFMPFFFVGLYAVLAFSLNKILIGILGVVIGIIYLTLISDAKDKRPDAAEGGF